jgi:hypothetical protein
MSITMGAPLVEASSAIMQAWCTDMAQQIHDFATIADRYGWDDDKAMLAYMIAHPVICRRIAEQRAVWESDENVIERVRRLAGYTILEALPNTAGVMFDPNNNPSLRIEALKAHARIAGLDGARPPEGRGAPGETGPTAAKFSVEIVFSNGQAEMIKTVEHIGDERDIMEGGSENQATEE